MKKVCAVISSLELGGAELSFKALVAAMVEWGWSVHVITLLPNASDESLGEIALPDSVSYECLGLTTRGKSFFQKLTTLKEIVSQLRKSLKSESPDLTVSFMAQTNLLTLLAAKPILKSSLKSSVLVAERVHPDFAPILRHRFIKPFMRFVRNFLYQRASIITVQAESMRNAFPAVLREKITAIPNSIRNFSSESVTEVARSKNILSVGRLVPQKDHTTLIKGFAKIFKKYPEWTLTIVGSGSDEEKLCDLARTLEVQEAVTFIPKTDALSAIFQSASIFALTSRYEGFPNVLLEAMSFGLPVVATNAPGASAELVHDEENGYLIPLGGISEAAEAFEKLIKDESLRQKFGEANLLVVKKYEPEIVMRKWKNILSECGN